MVRLSTLLSSLYFAAFGSPKTVRSREDIANGNRSLFNADSINLLANVSSLVMLNATTPDVEAGSVQCDNILFVEFPGFSSCHNAIQKIPSDSKVHMIGRRGLRPWDYLLPLRILSCKWALLLPRAAL